MPTPSFQIALVDRTPTGKNKLAYFNYSAKNIITHAIWMHIVAIARQMPNGLIPAPSWSLHPDQLKAHDVVVYFVASPEQSILKKLGATVEKTAMLGGRTGKTSSGLVSEVYVEGNMPAERLANIAFHEIMHNKLDIGSRAVADIHKLPNANLASPTTNEWDRLTKEEAALMAKHLLRPVSQHTGTMTAAR